MFVWWNKKGKARRVEDGDFEKRKCPECGKTAVFREVLVKSEVSVFSVVKLWDSEATKYACDRCGSIMDLDDTEDPELTAREQKRLEKQQAKALEDAQKKREAREARWKAEEVAREEQIDDEIADMKKRLGID